ncbi:MAG TPA: hypothetical protein EYH35_00550, partial [Thiotrichaceae bacterium]|nr:hypothetical protein [Thiotrichaceae bacterium]
PNGLAASDQVRYKIQCHDNIFFALSPKDTQFAYHPYLKVSSPTLIEGNHGTKTLFFEVSLTKKIANDVHFNFQTKSITTSSDDYVATTGRATLKANALSVLIGVRIKGDTEAEAHETVQLLVDAIESDTVLHYASAAGVGTIMDDDVKYHLTIDDVSLLEGDHHGEMVFTVTLSAVMPIDIIIPYQVLAGSANGSDVVLHSGSTVIKAGTQTAKIIATVVGDTRPEDDEYFTVKISPPESAIVVSVGDAVATGVIYNDDFVTDPSLSLGDVVISNRQNLQLDVMINKAVANNLSYEVLVSSVGVNDLKAKDDSTLKGIIHIPVGMTRGVVELPLNKGISNKSVVNVQVKKRDSNTVIVDENKQVIDNNVLAELPSTLVEKEDSGGGGSLGGLIVLFFIFYLLRSIGSGGGGKKKLER